MASCQNTSKTPAIDLANFDLSVAPNADFYEYATGGWQKNNPLKPEYSRYGSFDILRDNNEKRINELFSEMTKMKAEPGSIEQKISDLYKMGLDSVRLNAEGAAPVKDAVGEILAIGDRAQLTGAIAGLHTAIANPFFSVGVQADLMNSDINALYISQSGLTMGDRDYYLDPENENIRTAYKEYLGKLFRLAGIPEADIEKAVAGVMNIETKLAEKSWSNTELRDIPAQYNPTAKAEFEKTYDAIDWPAYYKAMGIGDFDTIIVTTKSSIANANDLMKNAPLEDIRYYLAAQYLDDAASYLSDDFQQASFDFYGKAMAGQQEMKPRWKRAMSVPNGILSEAVGEMYVAKYFPAKDKERMLGLVKNLQTALGQHIAALDWMSDATKAKAQEKLAAFTVKIGYPDKWKDYSTLAIDPSKSYFENIVNASLWYTADNISKLGKPVDKDEWHMSPQTVNAYYNPTTNEICFPAAILQPPFYNPEADDAVNYGAIGVVIGHEMTHGFDDQGRNFDKDGNMNNWWTDEDAAAFKAKTDILVKQFDAIEVLPAKEGQPAIFANGALSLGENIADQGGLRVARTAYRNSLAGREAPAPIDGFTPEQRFYLGYATLWAQNIRDEEIARLTKLDVHSLGKWRVNATLRNLQDFYDAFSIADGAVIRVIVADRRGLARFRQGINRAAAFCVAYRLVAIVVKSAEACVGGHRSVAVAKKYRFVVVGIILDAGKRSVVLMVSGVPHFVSNLVDLNGVGVFRYDLHALFGVVSDAQAISRVHEFGRVNVGVFVVHTFFDVEGIPVCRQGFHAGFKLVVNVVDARFPVAGVRPGTRAVPFVHIFHG